jgi:outer membrane protein OmpA-like peptidoglycan-associated protein
MEGKMATTLIDTVRQMITPALISQLSGVHGESIAAVQKGLDGASIALLGAIANRSDDSAFMSRLFLLFKESGIPPGLESTEGLLEQARGRASTPGTVLDRFQSLIFGDRTDVVSALARFAGIKSAAASSLLGIASSLVIGQLVRLIRTDRLDAGSLAHRFTTERSALQAATPPGLMLPTATARPAAEDAIRPDWQRAAVHAPPSQRAWSPLAWVGAALLAGLALWGLSSMLHLGRSPRIASVTTPSPVGTAGYVTRTLPGRADVHVRPSGTEDRVLAYIQNPSTGSSETWFEFDRLTFVTDSAMLRPESHEQLSNMAAILKAYPKVRVRIGGYTDNSGDPAANMRLSQARANAVAGRLRALGVDGSRLEAEGYGDQHPIASNATEDGRMRNRRVAIRVIGK